MENLELKVIELWNRSVEVITGTVRNKNCILRELEELKKSALTAGSINKYLKTKKELRETLSVAEKIAMIRESNYVIPSFEIHYNTIKDLNEKTEETRKYLLNKIQNNFQLYNEELNDRFKTQKFKEAKEIRKKLNVYAAFYRTLLKAGDSKIKEKKKEKRKLIFRRAPNRESHADNLLLNYCSNLKEYYAIPRKILKISNDYANTDWNEKNINALREIYEDNFVSMWGKEDILSKIRRLNLLEFSQEAEILKIEIELFLKRYPEIINLKREISSKQKEIENTIQEISAIKELNEQNIMKLVEGIKTVGWEIQKEFSFLNCLKEKVKKYNEMKCSLESVIESKISNFKIMIEEELARIKSYKPGFQSIDYDNKEIDEKISEFKNLERISFMLKSNFGTEIKGLREAEKVLNDYLNKTANAREKVIGISGEIEELKNGFEEILKSKDRTDIIKFENHINIKEQEYEELKNEPYLKTISGEGLNYISRIRDSVKKLKSLIEEEEKKKSKTESFALRQNLESFVALNENPENYLSKNLLLSHLK
jgi:hypothetical protein